jgi:hypothetical protein
MKIYGITDLIKNDNLFTIKNSSFFYIKRTEMVIPWYNIFTYFFYNIDNNLYINDTEFKGVLDPFFINNNLVTNEKHLDLLQNIGFDKIFVDKAFFITYTHNNAGHIFSEIMYQIYLYKTNKLDEYTLFITKELYNFSPFISSVIYYFFPQNLVNIINEKTLVEFNCSFVFKGSHYKNPNSIDFLINKLKIETNLIKIHNNICLIKTIETQSQNPQKSFDNEYNELIKSKNYNIIIPEKYTISELFNIIYNSDNIIMSWGCCSYLNSIFVNENSNILVLCHKDYRHEYFEPHKLNNKHHEYPNGILNSDWFPKKCKNKYILYDLPRELDESTKILLIDEIDKMI